jgi:hypothetical protein
MTEAIAPDRVCTRRQDAELDDQDGEVNTYPTYAPSASSLHDRTRRPEAETGVREKFPLEKQHAAATGRRQKYRSRDSAAMLSLKRSSPNP